MRCIARARQATPLRKSPPFARGTQDGAPGAPTKIPTLRKRRSGWGTRRPYEEHGKRGKAHRLKPVPRKAASSRRTPNEREAVELQNAKLCATGSLFLGFGAGFFDWGGGFGHAVGVEDFFHELWIEELAFEGDFRDGAAGLDAFLGDFRRSRVADVRIERRRNGDGRVGVVAAAFLVGLDSVDALFGEHAHGVLQNLGGMQNVPRHRRHHHVQFQLPSLNGKRRSHVRADGLKANHRGQLRHDGVYFSRHDGRSRLQRRQQYFRKPGVWSARQQSEIVRYANQFERQIAQCARSRRHSEIRLHRVAQVFRGNKFLRGDFAQLRDNQFLIFRMRVDAGADGGASEANFSQQNLRAANNPARAIYRGRVRAKFLSQADGNSVHHVRAAGFEDAVEFLAL